MKPNPRCKGRNQEKVLRKITSMCVFLVAALLGCLIIPSYSSLQAYQRISATGIVRAGMRKTVIWSDGSRETIQVTEKGRIFLNGSEVIAFGFHIQRYGDWGDWDDATANKALDRLMRDGVRFMELSIPQWFHHHEDEISELINFWMPKLYSHKMFVLLSVQDSDTEAPTVEWQMERVNIVIDEISKDKNWCDMVFAFAYTWETDYFYPGTAEELETYLANLYPRVRSAIWASVIGSVPVIGKIANPWGEAKGQAVARWSDIPSIDMYYRIIGTELDFTETAERTAALHQIINDIGKSGMNVWYTEFGLWYKNNTLFTKEKIEYGLSEAGYNDLSLMMIWRLWDRNQDGWSAFDGNGNPLDWYVRIAPYFPTLG